MIGHCIICALKEEYMTKLGPEEEQVKQHHVQYRIPLKTQLHSARIYILC